jgi:electron transfer flavoprotein alpha subunit
MTASSSGVWIWSERQDVALELLTPGRALGAALGAGVASIALGKDAGLEAAEPAARGADEVLVAADPRLDELQAELHVAALAQALAWHRPEVLLVGATCHGVEVAARLAQRLGVGCASGCLALEVRDGALVVERASLGRFIARQELRSRPAIAAVPPRRFVAPEPDPAREARITDLAVELPRSCVRVLGSRPRERSATQIDRAPVVVAVGRGLRRQEDLALVQELAEALGGVVGASRPLSDHLQWLPVDAKIGLSGQTVRPELYIACGISGQIEHVVGMRDSKVVVAINRDADAPIFQEADYCVVGDLYQVLPALTKAVGELRG